MAKTPEEIVADAIRVATEFESKLAGLDKKQQEVIDGAIKGAEATQISKVKAFIQSLFTRNTVV